GLISASSFALTATAANASLLIQNSPGIVTTETNGNIGGAENNVFLVAPQQPQQEFFGNLGAQDGTVQVKFDANTSVDVKNGFSAGSVSPSGNIEFDSLTVQLASGALFHDLQFNVTGATGFTIKDNFGNTSVLTGIAPSDNQFLTVSSLAGFTT